MFKIVRNVKSNSLWLIKDDFYHNYIRVIGPIFIRISKTSSYEN